MSQRKETIRISLGSNANEISSHLCNLEGLASTHCNYSSDERNGGNDVLCDPNITHRAIIQNPYSTSRRHYVPRALFIDTQDGFGKYSSLHKSGNDFADVTTWNGKIETYSYAQLQEQAQNDENQLQQLDGSQPNPFEMFHKASELFVEKSNRYEYPTTGAMTCHSSDLNYHQPSQSSNSRHMDWEDMGEEEDDDDNENYYYSNEDYEYKKKRMKEEELYHKERQLQNLYDQASESWNKAYSESSKKNISWFDYLLPPFPPINPSMLPLNLFAHSSYHSHHDQNPASNYNTKSNSMLHTHDWDNFVTGYNSNDLITKKWREDVMSEKLRYLLEETDAIDGFQFVLDGCGMGMYPGLGTSLLEEVHDECKSAKIFAILTDDDSANPLFSSSDILGKQDSRINSLISFRKQINYVLSLHGISSCSNLTLPINFPSCDRVFTIQEGHSSEKTMSKRETDRILGSVNRFQSSACAALAIECATLPYRLSTTSSSSLCSPPIALAGSSIMSDPYATTDRLNFSNFVSSLQPGNRHSLLSLDTCIFNNQSETYDIKNKLLQGMSIDGRQSEQDSRMRQIRNASHKFPGLWMTDGSLNNLSTSVPTGRNTSNHEYFAIAASFRPPNSTLSTTPDVPLTFAQPLLQGMIYRGRSPHQIRSLPDRLSACIVPSSIATLTKYGLYWDSVWGKTTNNKKQSNHRMTMSVISNSTRSYEKIETQITRMSQALKGDPFFNRSKKHKQHLQSWQGFMKQDIGNGRIPEEEDCLEVLEYFLDLSNTYEHFDIDTDAYDNIDFED